MKFRLDFTSWVPLIISRLHMSIETLRFEYVNEYEYEIDLPSARSSVPLRIH